MRAAQLLHRLPRPNRSAQERSDHRAGRHARHERAAPPVATATRAARVSLHERSMHSRDPAVARVRDAGGPIDNASYTCACGFVFAASVSTTVACPHCGAGQAW